MFHKDELRQVRAGNVVCVECGLERTFNEFLAEVLNGEHKELMAELKRQLLEDADL